MVVYRLALALVMIRAYSYVVYCVPRIGQPSRADAQRHSSKAATTLLQVQAQQLAIAVSAADAPPRGTSPNRLPRAVCLLRYAVTYS